MDLSGLQVQGYAEQQSPGQFPVEAVTVMARICVTSELAIDHNAMFESILTLTPKPLTRAEVGKPGMSIFALLNGLIGNFFISGQGGHQLGCGHHRRSYGIWRICSFRGEIPAIDTCANVNDRQVGVGRRKRCNCNRTSILCRTVYRQTLASRALWPMLVQGGKSDDEMMQDAIAYAQKNKWVAVDDWVIVVSGTQGIQGRRSGNSCFAHRS